MFKTVYKGIGTSMIQYMATHDLLYIDPNFAKFSAKKIEGYYTYTDGIKRKYPNHVLTPNGLINKHEPTTDLD